MRLSRIIETLPYLSVLELEAGENLCTYLILQTSTTAGLDKGYVRRRLAKLKETREQLTQEKLRRLT